MSLTRMIGLTFLVLAGDVTAASAQNYANYSPAKTINAMRSYDPKLKIIAAHRGHFYQDCPENSVCSVLATARDSVEAVEIDVRESGDGTLWPIHDTNIGRVTNYTLTGALFDPYASDSNNEKNNPAITDMNDRALGALKLRDPLGNVTSYSFITLSALLQQTDRNNATLVYIFDIKTAGAISKTAALVKQLGIQNRSVLKFNSTLTSPGGVSNLTGGVNFAPVLGTGSLDTIADNYNNGSSPIERVDNYVSAFSKVSGFVYFELRNKMLVGPSNKNQSVTVEGPLRDVDFYVSASKINWGGYAPAVEHYATSSQPGTGYYSLNGHCCTSLTARMDTSKYFGNDTRDDRENLSLMVPVNGVIIAERAGDALSSAKQSGYRDNVGKILN
jgi:hypothetical protein